jgi:hypothetical protein
MHIVTKWRLLVRSANGKQRYVGFSTESEARAYKAKLVKDINGRSVSEAVQKFVVEQRERGSRPGTVKVAEFRLRSFFQLDAKVDGKSMPYGAKGGMLERLQPARCEELYRELTKSCAVDTHRNSLATAKTFRRGA